MRPLADVRITVKKTNNRGSRADGWRRMADKAVTKSFNVMQMTLLLRRRRWLAGRFDPLRAPVPEIKYNLISDYDVKALQIKARYLRAGKRSETCSNIAQLAPNNTKLRKIKAYS